MNPKLQLALWVAHPVLELTLAGIIFARKLHRTYPVFFAYLIFQIINFAISFPIYEYGSRDAYFYSYWIGAGVSLAIGFKVIHEVFLDVFRPYHTLRDLGTVLFKWAALVMLLVALVVAAASPTGQDPLVQAVIIVQRCVRVIQCGLVLFLLVFSKYLGVSWRQHSFGIALGFGAFATIELVALALFSGGQIQPNALSLMNTAGYCFAILTWLAYSSLNLTARTEAATLLMSQRWDQSLGDLQHAAPADSLIPMFEGMVDRALSRAPRQPEAPEIEREPLTAKVSSNKALHASASAKS